MYALLIIIVSVDASLVRYSYLGVPQEISPVKVISIGEIGSLAEG
jgi:hypothetical protein